MPKYLVEMTDGSKYEVESDGEPTEADVMSFIGGQNEAPAEAVAPAPQSALSKAVGFATNSLIPKQEQLDAASAVAGTPQQPLANEHSAIPFLGPILDAVKAASSSGSDIASGLWNHPVETLRGGAAGLTEGVMDQASPLNLASGALPFLRALRGAKGAAAATPQLARTTGTAFAGDALVQAPAGVRGLPPGATGGFSRPVAPPPRALPPEAIATGTRGTSDALVPAGGWSKPFVTPKPTPPPVRTTGTGTGFSGSEIIPTGGMSAGASGTGGWSIPAPVREAVTKAAAVSPLNKAPSVNDSLIEVLNRIKSSPTAGGSLKTLDDAERLASEAKATTAGALNTVVDAVKKAAGAKKLPAITQAADDALKAGTHPVKVADSIEKALPQTLAEIAKDSRAMWGSAEAGKRMFPEMAASEAREAVKRLAPGPSRFSLKAEGQALDNEFMRRMADPKGAISGKGAILAGAGATGAAIGGTQGDTTEEHLTNAVYGGAAGVAAAAVAVPMLAHLAAASAPKLLQNGLYASILARPASISKAYLGGVGGAITSAMELMETGNIKQGTAILNRLFSKAHVTDTVAAFRNPSSIKSAKLAKNVGYDGDNLLGKIYDASQGSAIKSMVGGGMSMEDAWRATLSGPPTTAMGKDILNLWNKWFSIRLGTSLFPRVGIQVIERGLERSPLGLVKGLGLSAEGTSPAMRTARALNGPAVAAAAYAWGDSVPDWGKPFVAAATGPYGLPVGAGLAAGKAQRQGKDASGQALAAADTIGSNTPFPPYGINESIHQLAGGSTLVPGVVGDIARARDPHERDTRGQSFGRLRAKVPGLREGLPQRALPTNIAGEQTQDRSSKFKRFMTTASFERDPNTGIPEAVTSEIKRLGIELNSPSPEKKVSIGGRDIDVPPDAIARLQRERRQYLVPAIEKLLASPAYKAATDASKKARMDATISKAQATGSARAKATLSKLLKGRP